METLHTLSSYHANITHHANWLAHKVEDTSHTHRRAMERPIWTKTHHETFVWPRGKCARVVAIFIHLLKGLIGEEGNQSRRGDVEVRIGGDEAVEHNNSNARRHARSTAVRIHGRVGN